MVLQPEGPVISQLFRGLRVCAVRLVFLYVVKLGAELHRVLALQPAQVLVDLWLVLWTAKWQAAVSRWILSIETRQQNERTRPRNLCIRRNRQRRRVLQAGLVTGKMN